ncbi:MAG: excinuclease ABC subunit C [Desulfococcus sp. 4484_242]|nr:MAG: excinuclease ABC subunit C [Desulfococcus sp. 4484_242]
MSDAGIENNWKPAKAPPEINLFEAVNQTGWKRHPDRVENPGCHKGFVMDNPANACCGLNAERLRKDLPAGPGVYLFKDGSGRVIYVGKAKDLRKRVLSYFRPADRLSGKTAVMMKKAASLDFILTSTENEAFILESSLIKKNMPRYNVILRDDKQYPCLRLDINEDYPRLSIVRRIKKDGALYFGPFSSAGAVKSTRRIIDRVFKLRKCRHSGLPRRSRPCLNYQMGRCLGPCTNDVPAAEYREIVDQVRLFLEGRNRELIHRLRVEMTDAADRLDFERAALIRDQIGAIEKTVERQHVVSRKLEDQDIIGLTEKDDMVPLVILFVRKGYVVGSRNYFFRNRVETASEIMEAFLKQYYAAEPFIPEQILISEPVGDLLSITRWLSDRAGKKVTIHRPVRGEKLRLVKMAVANAENVSARKSGFRDEDLSDLVQSRLGLRKPPRFIEGLDISNFQGQLAVGTVVRFADGLPERSGYRNYRIKSVNGVDDYAMMTELVERRVRHGKLPDLFLVDGGRGHLACVKNVLDNRVPAGMVEVVSIAKPDENRQEKLDKIYLPGRKNPLVFRADSPVLHLMMRIRDEAHRRAISYHRKLREKALTGSELDQIPGIGEKRRNNLLRHFGDSNAVSRASLESLLEVPGITAKVAQAIHSHFRE